MNELRGYLAKDNKLLAKASKQYREMVAQMHTELSKRLEKDDMRLATWRKESERFATLDSWVRWNSQREQPNLFPLCLRVKLDATQAEPRLQHRKRKAARVQAYALKPYRSQGGQLQVKVAEAPVKLKAPSASTWCIINPTRDVLSLSDRRAGLPWSMQMRKEHGDFFHAWLWCCADSAKNRRPCVYFLVVLLDALRLKRTLKSNDEPWHVRERIAFAELHALYLETFAVPLFDIDVSVALDNYRHAMQVCQSEMR